MEQDIWPPTTKKQRKMFTVIEATLFCATNMKSIMDGTMPYHIILKRCKYVSSIIKCINKECSALCLKASKADKPSTFIEHCKKSSELWNATVKKEKDEENRRVGVV